MEESDNDSDENMADGRHLDSDVSPAVQTLAREGRDRARALYPAQTRERQHFQAMEAVTMDGHRFDVFVKFPASGGNPEFIVRPQMVAFQDIFFWYC